MEKQCRIVCDPLCHQVCSDPLSKWTRRLGFGMIFGGTIVSIGVLIVVAALEILLGIVLFIFGGIFLNPLFYAFLGIVFGFIGLVCATRALHGNLVAKTGILILVGVFSGLTILLMIVFIVTTDSGMGSLIPFYIVALVGSAVAISGTIFLLTAQ